MPAKVVVPQAFGRPMASSLRMRKMLLKYPKLVSFDPYGARAPDWIGWLLRWVE